MPLGTEVGLVPGDSELDGDPVTQLPTEMGTAAAPNFSFHVYCAQTAGRINLVRR